MRGKRIGLAVLWAVLSLCLSAEDIRLYQIGNSLTFDTKPTAQVKMLNHNGYNVSSGYHIACGRSLIEIVEDPDYTCQTPPSPYGNWTNALQNYEWDVITIQAYPGGTGEEEVLATMAIIDEAIAGDRNLDCVFYLYLAWPKRADSPSFEERVRVPFGGDEDDVFLSEGFLDYWYTEVCALFPDLDIRVIPTGIVYATMDSKLREIAMGGYADTDDLYRDVDHMNLDEGRHVAMLALFCAITGIHPTQDIYPSDYHRATFDTDFLELTDKVVWHTLTVDSRTGVHADPAISVEQLSDHSMLECVFTGTLLHSDNLVDWEAVSDATSPYRYPDTEATGFYKSSDE